MELSIIIPHFNSPGLLGKLLGSIPVRDDVQVIVVDDNSTEGADVLARVIEDDGRCEFYKNHTGKNSAGTCRNIGLSHTTGKWVMFADADDYYLDDFYDTVSVHFDSEADIVYFPPTSADIETGKLSNRHVLSAELVRQYIRRRDKKSENSLKYRFCEPWSKMYRRELVEAHGIEFELRLVANDMIFGTKYALCALTVQVSDKVIYCITSGSSSLTTKTDVQSFADRLDVHLLRHKLLREKLAEKEIRQLGIFSADFLLMALRQFGVRKMLETAGAFRRHGIRLFNFSLFNLRVMVGQLGVRN